MHNTVQELSYDCMDRLNSRAALVLIDSQKNPCLRFPVEYPTSSKCAEFERILHMMNLDLLSHQTSDQLDRGLEQFKMKKN